MATTKKRLEEDFTKQPQATTQADVDSQDSRTRLWQSLNNAYGQQAEDTQKAYDLNINSTLRAAQARGMGRSSYAMQTMANMENEKVKALNRISDNQIADYQNRITALEQQEAENEFRERQFQEGIRQFDASQELTRSENALNRAHQTSERLGSQEYATSERIASQEYNTRERLSTQDWQSSEKQKDRDLTTSERIASQIWQSGENALTREQTDRQFNEQMAYNRESSEREVALAVIQVAAANGGDVSPELLKKAGLKKTDYDAMKKKVSSGKSGGSKKTSDSDMPEWKKLGYASEEEYIKDKEKNLESVHLKPGEMPLNQDLPVIFETMDRMTQAQNRKNQKNQFMEDLKNGRKKSGG